MHWYFGPIEIDNVHAVIGIIILLALESRWPAAVGRQHRWRHLGRNISLSLFNLIILAGIFAPLMIKASAWAEVRDIGLLRMLSLPAVPNLVSAMILMDCWMYIWHRANHRVPFLWRFHRVHHSDPEMDVSSATRFHPGEIAISSSLRILLIPVLGVTLADILLYDALLYPFIQFHHSNVRVPLGLDRLLRVLIVSPRMHRIHHSPVQSETDSNYGSIFSFWDRLGSSFRMRRDDDPSPFVFGLDGLSDEHQQRVLNLLMLPTRSGTRVG